MITFKYAVGHQQQETIETIVAKLAAVPHVVSVEHTKTDDTRNWFLVHVDPSITDDEIYETKEVLRLAWGRCWITVYPTGEWEDSRTYYPGSSDERRALLSVHRNRYIDWIGEPRPTPPALDTTS
jgi:hypothetical protein